MTKEELRKMMKNRRRTLSASRILFYSAIVTDKLVREKAYASADTIFAYYSVSAELSMDYLYEQAWNDGKKIALPVCLPGNELEFRYYTKGMELEKGHADSFWAWAMANLAVTTTADRKPDFYQEYRQAKQKAQGIEIIDSMQRAQSVINRGKSLQSVLRRIK